MQIGKTKPTATIVAQFAAGVEVETIQHEGKIFFPVMSLGDFASAPTEPERKGEPKPEAPAPAEPTKPAPAASAPAPSGKTYTKDEMMEMASKDLEKILRKEFGIDPDKFEGKNTNKKLRDLILDAQKKGGAKAAPDKEEEPAEETGDNSEVVEKVTGLLNDFDSGKLSRKKALSAIAEACGTDDTDAVSDLLDKFEDDGEATPEDFAKTIVDELLGEGGGDSGSEEEPEGEVVDIADLEKGDRVAVWWNDDNQAWFTGEVASVKRGKVTVKYDDDTEGVLEPELHTIIKRIEE